MWVLDNLRSYLQSLENQPQNFLIAYSGGLDSHVLLHAMVQLKSIWPELKLTAIHVNHGLSKNAQRWAQHCRNICDDLKVDFLCQTIETAPLPGESIEAWAREARYNIFKTILPSQALLVTAHTQDDQAETVLLQLFRGAGPKGLAAMPDYQLLGLGHLCRPFLQCTRQQLQEYAEQYQLSWIEDESNNDCRFDRNFLRQQIIPLLQQRWPAIKKNMSRSAGHCAEASAILTEVAQEDLLEINSRLSVKLLLSLSPARQRNALRHWLTINGCRLPNTLQLHQIQKNLLNSRHDSNPQVTWGKWTIRRYRHELVLSDKLEMNSMLNKIIPWNLQFPLELPNNLGYLTAWQDPEKGISLSLDPELFSIRFREGGEWIKPAHSQHSVSLKKLYQKLGIPPWERQQVPLLYYGEQLISVIGYCIAADFAAQDNQPGWLIVYQ